MVKVTFTFPDAEGAYALLQKLRPASGEAQKAEEPAAPAPANEVRKAEEPVVAALASEAKKAEEPAAPVPARGRGKKAEEPAVSYDQIKAAALRLAKEKGREALVSVLTGLGLKTAAQAKPEQYPELLAAIHAAERE